MVIRRKPRASTTVAPPAQHWKLTADQYQRMGETGILHEDDHVELLEGELWEMSPIGDWHNSCVDRCTWRLGGALGGRAILRVQGSFRLSPVAEPEPDLLVLRFRDDFYAHGSPGRADVLLLIEVADSSLAYDHDFKLPLYARAGIPDVWIANRTAMRFEIYREPRGGVYQSVTFVERGGTLTPLAFPDLTIQVSDILG